MKLFFDHDSLLRQALEVKAAPLKIFLEDGIVKKIWVGSSAAPEAKEAFVRDYVLRCHPRPIFLSLSHMRVRLRPAMAGQT